MKKDEFLRVSAKVQVTASNTFLNIPAQVRSILKPKKGDEIEFIIYSDRTVEIKMKE